MRRRPRRGRSVPRDVVIHGPAGVGKSRLADEVVQRAVAAGWYTVRARGSAAAGAMPLGALVHLLPRELLDNRFDPVALYGEVVAFLDQRRAGQRLVLLVDDLQWLDTASAALLGQLVDGGTASLVGTVRSGRTCARRGGGTVATRRCLRVDLDALTASDVDTLLHLALGGPVHSGAIDAI